VRLFFWVLLASASVGSVACGGWGGGTNWVNQPLVPEEERAPMSSSAGGGATNRPGTRTLGAPPPKESLAQDRTGGGGKVLGTFRNTYYDFPNEADHGGAPVALMNAKCETIAKVPRGFYEAVCVQGSGSLARGGTVSFAKRDCACAEICPRTNQRICFDTLDKATFPWGRGAAGSPITPLRSIAADTQVLPMGTVLYIPELDGVRGTSDTPSDGCFVVEDRGLKVQGEHVDIFTGHPTQTAALNAQVPSNQGVTVVVDSPRCQHLARH
jgi:3D (Asp-Asp-Asp) domain-containing protein